MKKILLGLLATTLTTGFAFAQQLVDAPFKIEKSEVFDAPHPKRWCKVLQMKNGNTMYLHSPQRDGVVVDVYDKQRKHIAGQHLETKIWNSDDVQKAIIYGVFEIGGEVVFFVDQDRKIYRIRLNGTNGSLVQEDVLSEHAPAMSAIAKHNERFSKPANANYKSLERSFVAKDNESDCYAFLLVENVGSDYLPEPRIRILHFDEKHQKLSDQVYKKTEASFANIRLCSGVVDGNRSVCFVLEATNGKDFGKAPSVLLVAKLNAGERTFKNAVLKINGEFEEWYSEVVYNRAVGQLQLLSLGLVGKKEKNMVVMYNETRYYSPMIISVDVKTLDAVNVKQISLVKVNEYLQRHMNKDATYNGMLQLMVANKDNTTALLFEGISSLDLESIGISQISETGSEIEGYVVEKKQAVIGDLPLMFHHRRLGGYFDASTMEGGIQDRFISYNYLPATKGNYVIYNDVERNVSSEEGERCQRVVDLRQTGMVCCKLGSSGMGKSFVFGDPGKWAATYSYIDAADYKEDTDTYATIIVERNGHRDEARLAWITFE